MVKPCTHALYADGHCADMTCANYINKCPMHGIVRKGNRCSNE